MKCSRYSLLLAASIALLFCSCDLGPVNSKSGSDTRWRVYTRTIIKPSRQLVLSGQPTGGLVLAFSLDGRRALHSNVCAGKSGPEAQIYLVDLETGKKLTTLRGNPPSTQCVAFSGHGTEALSGGPNGVVRMWNLSNGNEIEHANGHGCYVRALACSPTEGRAVSGGEKGTLILWDLEDLKIIKRFTGHTSAIRHNCLVWSTDGKRILSGSWDGSIRLWDVNGGKQLASLNPGYGRVMSVALSPDGKRALSSYLSGPDQPVVLWDLETQQELNRFGIPGNPWYADQQLHVSSVTFLPDGKAALFGLVFGTVILWDLDQWQQISLNWLHKEELALVRCSPDGQTSLSIGCDADNVTESATIKYWEFASTNKASPGIRE